MSTEILRAICFFSILWLMAKPQIRVIVSQAELDQVRGQACAEGVSISSLARLRLGLPANPTPGGYRGGGRPKGSRNKPKGTNAV